MEKSIIDTIERRISRIDYKPDDIATGMSGSFLRFKMSLNLHEFLTEDEFETYDGYLYSRHGEIFAEVNNVPVEEVSFDINDYSLTELKSCSHK